MKEQITKKGFTLLELLIVISIIAILSVILIVALNPAETLRQARDTQRMSDLSSIKTALSIYTTTAAEPVLDGDTGNKDNADCQATAGTWAAGDKIWYSLDSGTAITGDGSSPAGFDGSTDPAATQVAAADVGKVNGDGWIPVNLTNISGGSPISNFPVDPTNSVTTLASGGGTVSAADRPNANALVYRYACQTSNLQFELNAALESTQFRTTDDKDGTDGGNSTLMFEVGTNLDILGANATDATNAGF